VISRISVMRYKGSQKSLPEIARELRIDAVVEGSVVRVRDRVRITAQLIRAPTDVHLWAKSYERDLGDTLALQDDVARAIADEIRIKLTPQQASRLSSTTQVNPEAHDAYLRGLSYLNERTKPGITKSIDTFKQAVAHDPKFAPAYVGLAMAYNVSASGWGVLSPDDAFPQARAAALEALKLQPDLAEAHSELAYEKVTFEHDWTGAKEEFQRAIRLDPNSADAHYNYALSWLTPTGRNDEAIAEIQKTLDLDPVSLPHNQGAVYIFYFARRYQDALNQCRTTIDLDRNFAGGHWRLFEVYTQLGRYDEAVSELETAWLLDGGDRGEVARWIGAYRKSVVRSGGRGFWQQVAKASQIYFGPVYVARAYAHLGQKDDAFIWLEKGFKQRDSDITLIAVDPAFESLHSDPRYADLLRRIGLPQ
jgi:tetratricopeptide (TPR) repeat protein